MTWWHIIYTKESERWFRNLASRRLGFSREDPEPIVDEVRQELALKLQAMPSAPQSPRSFVTAAFRNAMEDYLRARDGYPRPPAWIKRLGGAYERVFRLLCLEGRAVEEIRTMLASLYQHSREFIDDIVREIRSKVPNCGESRHYVALDDAQPELDMQSQHACEVPEAQLENNEIEAALGPILGQDRSPDANPTLSAEWLRKLQHAIQLDDDARLLLRLVYTEGYTVSEAARTLKLKDADARAKLTRTLKHLRQVFEQAGLDLEDLL